MKLQTRLRFLMLALLVVAAGAAVEGAAARQRTGMRPGEASGVPEVGYIVRSFDVERLERNVRNALQYAVERHDATPVRVHAGQLQTRDGELLAYDRFDTLWFNATARDASRKVFAEEKDRAAIASYVRGGGGLLLTASGLFLLNDLGIEDAVPRYIPANYNSRTFSNSFSVGKHRAHPVFKGFKFDFQPYITYASGGICAVVDFRKKSFTYPKAKQLSSQKTRVKAIAEFPYGEGMILTIGCHIPDFTSPNRYRENVYKLVRNALYYTAGLRIETEPTALATDAVEHERKLSPLRARISIDPQDAVRPVQRLLFGVHICHNRRFEQRAIWKKADDEVNLDYARAMKALGLETYRWNMHRRSTWLPKGQSPRPHTVEELKEGLVQAQVFSRQCNVAMEDCTTFLRAVHERTFPDGEARMPVSTWEDIARFAAQQGIGLRFWEIWNEPWAHQWKPLEYAEYVASVGTAIKEIQPAARICVSGNFGYSQDLEIVKQSFPASDCLVMHLYFGRNGAQKLTDYYRNSYSGVEVARRILRRLHAGIADLDLGRRFPIVITEWGSEAGMLSYPNNLMQALNDGAFLMMLQNEGIVPMAHYTINNGWRTGMLGTLDLKPHPVAFVFKLMSEYVRGNQVRSRCESESFRTDIDLSGLWARKYGVSATSFEVPYVSALATRQGKTLSIVIINKDHRRDARVQLSIPGIAVPSSATVAELNDFSPDKQGVLTRNYRGKNDMLRDYVQHVFIKRRKQAVERRTFEIQVKKHSMLALRLPLERE